MESTCSALGLVDKWVSFVECVFFVDFAHGSASHGETSFEHVVSTYVNIFVGSDKSKNFVSK